MSILPEYVEVTSYKKRCNLITLHDSASQKRSLKFFMRTIRFSLLNFIWKYTTPSMQKKYLALQSSGFIGLKENLENQEKIWKIEKSGKTWKI